MKRWLPESLASRLQLLATIPLIVSSLGWLASEGVMPGIVSTILGVSSAILIFLIVRSLNQSIQNLESSAQAILAGQAGPSISMPKMPREGQMITQAFLELTRRREAILQEYQSTLNQVASYLETLNQPGNPVASIEVQVTNLIDGQRIHQAMNELQKSVTLVRHRLQLMTKIAQSSPAAMVAVDEKGTLRYLNQAAERILGPASQVMYRRGLGTFVSDQVSESMDPLRRTVEGRDGVIRWLTSGTSHAIVTEIRGLNGNRNLVELSGSVFGNGKDRVYSLNLRPLENEQKLIARDRSLIREQTTLENWSLTLSQTESFLESVDNQSRILLGEVKQSSQRDHLVPRLQTIQRQQQAFAQYISILRWLRDSLQGTEPPTMNAEFMAVEVARRVVESLAERLDARKNKIQLMNQGGWIYGDEEWIGMILQCVLMHANAAQENAEIDLRIRTLAAERDSTSIVEYMIQNAGPMLNEHQQAVLRYPFGALENSGLISTSDQHGYALALLLAHRLVGRLQGTIQLEGTQSGRLNIRILLPTRLPGSTEEYSEMELAEVGPIQELCLGWRLGTPVFN